MVVLPALPFGPTPEHRSYGAGYIDLPRELHDAVVHSTLQSLVEQGFRRMVIWRGGHDFRSLVDRFNAEHNGAAEVYLPALPYHDIWCRIGDASDPGGHAEAFATSIALHLRPESVRLDQIAPSDHRPVDWSDPDLDFRRYSSSGVIGDPTTATAELGVPLARSRRRDCLLATRDELRFDES